MQVDEDTQHAYMLAWTTSTLYIVDLQAQAVLEEKEFTEQLGAAVQIASACYMAFHHSIGVLAFEQAAPYLCSMADKDNENQQFLPYCKRSRDYQAIASLKSQFLALSTPDTIEIFSLIVA